MRSTLILLLFKLLFFFLNVGLNVGLNAPNAPNAPTKLGPQLGQSSHVLSNPAALGTWSWGNKLLYSHSSKTDDAPILQAYKCSRQMGVNVFDTGDSYGTGELEGNAERLLRTCEDSYRNEQGEEVRRAVARRGVNDDNEERTRQGCRARTTKSGATIL